jgi:hypothetical protein
MAGERGVIKIRFDEKFYHDRIDSIVGMTCDGIFRGEL